jgi:GNAT superfamily N-acetyltransferase
MPLERGSASSDRGGSREPPEPLDRFRLRPATPSEAPRLSALIRESVLGLSGADYSLAQLESALRYLFGVDSRLIEDGTYFLVEDANDLAACGGWSARRTLFGGDQYADRADDRLDPSADAARIRAFFVHPSHARRGLGSLLLGRCESEARERGFRRMELMATLTGITLYARAGYRIVERVDLELPDGTRFPLAKMEKEL